MDSPPSLSLEPLWRTPAAATVELVHGCMRRFVLVCGLDSPPSLSLEPPWRTPATAAIELGFWKTLAANGGTMVLGCHAGLGVNTCWAF
ncbi:hypothetical protein V6N11_059516 [Hibiscus sabdariffa]|uniref:Uncharacterized protein n=1 Tax=Hibiscus sabdariffa TaxID=183260 RepID=A0ABR2ACB1_9ROSI